jgi:hypothetical protein
MASPGLDARDAAVLLTADPAQSRRRRGSPSDAWFVAGGVIRLLGVLGLAAGVAGREGGFGALALALISLFLVIWAPVIAFVASIIAFAQNRDWPRSFSVLWRIVVIGAAVAFDISGLASGRHVPPDLPLLSLFPPVLDGVVVLLLVPRAARRGAGWYLVLCAAALAVFLALAALSVFQLNGTGR